MERQSATAACMERLRRYPDVLEDIAPGDPMFEPGNYLLLGRSAFDAIRLAMLCAQKDTPKRILDFACGYGRTLRFLRAEYPEASIAACDIDHGAVDFCAEAFGAEAIYGHEDPATVEIDERFDLIWVCSLFTHLDEPDWAGFFEFFQQALVPGGLLAFTVHGRAIARRLRDPRFASHYLVDEERNRALAESVDGFAFAEYRTASENPQPSRYGISLVEPEWVLRFLRRYPNLLVTSYVEDRFGGQDVVGVTKVEPGVRVFREPLTHPKLDS